VIPRLAYAGTNDNPTKGRRRRMMKKNCDLKRTFGAAGYDEDGMPVGMPRVKLILTVIACRDDKEFLEKAERLISAGYAALSADAVSHELRIVKFASERFPAQCPCCCMCRA